MMDLSPYFWWRGESAISEMMVVQLGLAMMFLGVDFAASGLISGTTSGTSGSIRNADELSITIHPALAADGAYSSDMPPPAEKRATSIPSKQSCVSSLIIISSPRKVLVCPADLADASRVSFLIGKFLSARQFSISSPTAPVAPTMAMCFSWFIIYWLIVGEHTLSYS